MKIFYSISKLLINEHLYISGVLGLWDSTEYSQENISTSQGHNSLIYVKKLCVTEVVITYKIICFRLLITLEGIQ